MVTPRISYAHLLAEPNPKHVDSLLKFFEKGCSKRGTGGFGVEIEHLPVADNAIDVILSNCVINLSPDKPCVFKEAFRVLKPGGRLAISDTVAMEELPEQIRSDMKLHAGCIAGATVIDELKLMLQEAGFVDIQITPKETSRDFISKWAPGVPIEHLVVSATIEATKPAN